MLVFIEEGGEIGMFLDEILRNVIISPSVVEELD
jgi:hypothetical protein